MKRPLKSRRESAPMWRIILELARAVALVASLLSRVEPTTDCSTRTFSDLPAERTAGR